MELNIFFGVLGVMLVASLHIYNGYVSMKGTAVVGSTTVLLICIVGLGVVLAPERFDFQLGYTLLAIISFLLGVEWLLRKNSQLLISNAIMAVTAALLVFLAVALVTYSGGQQVVLFSLGLPLLFLIFALVEQEKNGKVSKMDLITSQALVFAFVGAQAVSSWQEWFGLLAFCSLFVCLLSIHFDSKEVKDEKDNNAMIYLSILQAVIQFFCLVSMLFLLF